MSTLPNRFLFLSSSDELDVRILYRIQTIFSFFIIFIIKFFPTPVQSCLCFTSNYLDTLSVFL